MPTPREIYDSITAEVERNERKRIVLQQYPAVEAKRPLSAREVQILQLAAAGKSNAAIGMELGIKEATVRSHFRRMAKALGTGRREVMVLIAMRSGLVH